MTAKEMFENDGWEEFSSDGGRFLWYEKDIGDNWTSSICIDFFEKTIEIFEHRGENLNLVLNNNEVDAFLELIKELKEAGKWNSNTIC